MNEDEFKERLERASSQDSGNDSNPSAAPDAIIQKLIQELAEGKRENTLLVTRIEELGQKYRGLQADLGRLSNGQQQIRKQVSRMEEAIQTQPEPLSAEEIEAEINDKILVFKVQLGCILFAALMVAAVLWLWPDNRESEPQEPAGQHLSTGGYGEF